MGNKERDNIIDECIKVISGLKIAYSGENAGESNEWDGAISAACIELQELKYGTN
jgi:hypothetical protein